MKRVLSPEQQAYLLASVRLRDQLTDKALAAKLGLSHKQVRNQVQYLREAQRNAWTA